VSAVHSGCRTVIRSWSTIAAAGLVLAAVATVASGQSAAPGSRVRHECVVLQDLDRGDPFVSDPAECGVKTAPASTFKIPHSLIALDSGVVANPLDVVKWDGSKQPFPAWEQDLSLDAAVKVSAVWFFRRTAGLIGRERMTAYLKKFEYAGDTFKGDLTNFWLNGDLVVSPQEQLRFLQRLARFDLPVERRHIDAVMAAFLMPRGRITNATGSHEFVLKWPEPLVVHAKTGATSVGDERVSWLIGHVVSNRRQYIFASRVRAREDLPGTPGADLALRVLNAHAPEIVR
jgi:beta-lactamase class D